MASTVSNPGDQDPKEPAQASEVLNGPRQIVIVGGGVIGCITAYYITRHPSFNPSLHTVILLEATSIASGASGKAGGLLATWAYPSCIVPLSFALHAQLAAEHNGAERWGYRRLGVGSIAARGLYAPAAGTKTGSEEGKQWNKLPKVGGKRIQSACISCNWGKTKCEGGAPCPRCEKKGIECFYKSPPKETSQSPDSQSSDSPPQTREEGEHYGAKGTDVDMPSDLDWFDSECISGWKEMGTPETTAQVHPLQFTTAIASLAVEAGLKIIYGRVTALDYTGPHGIKSVTYEDRDTKHIHTLPCSDAILAAGPWTSHVFPEVQITALRAHSVVIEKEVSPYAVFTEIELPRGWRGAKKKRMVNPEMYARPDGTVYACGDADSRIPLPLTTSHVICDVSKCDDLFSYISSISPSLASGTVISKQACYLPSVGDGNGPLIGETGIRGLLMATGHTCWGIQNSAATGKLVSEILFEGKARSAEVGGLDPRVFMGRERDED